MAYSHRPQAEKVWTIQEGDRYFKGVGLVHETLKGITSRLNELGIPYVIAGGLALFQHGYRRFTEDVDILVRKDDLAKLHEHLEGRGYLPKFEGARNLKDTKTGVSIEFLVTGEYPGDGKQKPVAFPDPEGSGIEIEGISFLNLPKLVEMKLSSGMTNPERLRDLADVQQLIRALGLPQEFANKLDPYVRAAFFQLWESEHRPRRFVRVWTGEEDFEQMLLDGVVLESGSKESGRAVLVTENSQLAARFDMHEESEYL